MTVSSHKAPNSRLKKHPHISGSRHGERDGGGDGSTTVAKVTSSADQ
jgi:hypothetical protein